MEIRFEKVEEFDTGEQSIIEECIKETLNKHPFLKNLNKPDLLRVGVEKIKGESSINHKLFPKNSLVILYLGEEIYDKGRTDRGRDEAGGAWKLNESELKKVLSHEFGHFIDARLNPKFGYKDEDYERKRYKNIYDLLWNSYIDGRLCDFNLNFSNLEQIKDQISVITKNPKDIIEISNLVKRGWNKEFTTHKEILDKTVEIYGKIKKETDDKKANI